MGQPMYKPFLASLSVPALCVELRLSLRFRSMASDTENDVQDKKQ